VVEGVIKTATVISIGTLVLSYTMSLLANGPLQSLLNKMKTLQLATHMMAVKLVLPATCEKIFSYIFEATIFDVFPLEIFYDLITGVEIVDPPSAELETVGYDSVTAIRNIGSLFLIITFAYLMIVLLRLCSYCLEEDDAPCKKPYES